MSLALPEQLTILSADERGRSQFSVPNLFNSALAAAALLELLWADCLSVTPEAVTVTRQAALPSASVTAVAATIANHEPLRAESWVRLSRSPLPGLRDMVQHRLMEQGLFLLRPCRKLFVIPATCLAPDPGYREQVLHETREVLLGPEPPDEPRLWALGALVDVSGLVYRLYRDYPELKAARERAELLGSRLMGPVSDEGTRLIMQGAYAARKEETEFGPSVG